MAAAAPVAPADNARPSGQQRKGVQPLRAGEGHSFLWRKLHSLSGIIPIGAFLVEHIISNFETWNGPLAYAQQVKFLNALPLVRVLEWTFVFHPPRLSRPLRPLHRRPRPRQCQPLPLGLELDVRLPARHRHHRVLLHHPARLAAALQPASQLPENPGAAFHKVQVELSNPWMLTIYVIAMIATTWHFSLWHLALCRQVGHHPRRTRPQEASATSAEPLRHRPLPHGPRQHLRRRLEVPQRPRRRHARPTCRHRPPRTRCRTTQHH